MSIVKCGRCNGTGHHSSAPGGVCQGCGGDGNVVVPDPPTKCGRCNGTGHHSSAPGGVCQGCGGCGWVLG